MNRNTSPLFQLIILISIITFGFADTLSAADADGLTITVEANQSIRDIAQKYLNNPDLWEDILRENKLKSAADVKPGMQLFIPVKAITSAIAELDKSHKTIQEATQAGAKIFATEDINRAIDNRNRALEARKSSDWNQCTSLAKTATTAAAKALELSKAQQDVATEASIYRRTGNVQGKRPEQNLWNELALNSRLIEGERVRTLSSSYAEIQFRDESRIRMNENSQTLIRRVRANLLEKKEEASVSLIEGDVMALLAQGSGKKKGKGAFEIDVPGVKTDLNSDHF